MSIASQELLASVIAEKTRLESLGRTGGGQYKSAVACIDAAIIIDSDPDLADQPRREGEAIDAWSARVLPQNAFILRRQQTGDTK